ncbi:hypothetical protein CEXT_287341 [Caerostris extrusa]|uniref:Uncharacterized protein n=1 Tax=Caerostris extrusa TaxID=172846 RepID=A0AAV4M578_CAEEX|nr:hypothetical protein CEXT_287341 [Caerostris extrusa]
MSGGLTAEDRLLMLLESPEDALGSGSPPVVPSDVGIPKPDSPLRRASHSSSPLIRIEISAPLMQTLSSLIRRN